MDKSRLIHWAEGIGVATAEVVRTILERKPHPEMGYRTCLGILSLEKIYSKPRLEAAGQRAFQLQAFSYQSLKSILKRSLDRQPTSADPCTTIRPPSWCSSASRDLKKGTVDVEATQLSFEERFALLIDQQWLWKENRALARRLRAAHLKEPAVIEDVDYQHPRGHRKLVRTLTSSDWVRQHQSILLLGPTDPATL
jgi:hypothetical protein